MSGKIREKSGNFEMDDICGNPEYGIPSGSYAFKMIKKI